ncbi:MAG: lysophospholipid acyltransferase family protein [Gammaproteobacteria bacterium]|nr:lysophospholipid acyltransferase family protein [Gammaproteobacteria bacterium]
MSRFSKLLLKVFAHLPLAVVQAIGGFLGMLSGVFPNRRLQTTKVNIALCFPELPHETQKKLVRRSLIESGKGALESSTLWLKESHYTLGLVKKTSGEEYLESAHKLGRGVILALPHLGMWEIIGLYCSSRYPMTSLFRPPPLAAMDDVMRAGRQRLGARLVPTDKSGVRALYTALEKGELVAILPDQEPGAGSGLFAPFFGIQANTMVLLSRLAIKTGAAVLFVYAERLPGGKGYHIHFSPASEHIHDPDLNTSVRYLNQGIEDCVRALPEQYLWSYKRFRNRPEGEAPIYKT